MQEPSVRLKKANPVRDKSYTFALHIVHFCKNLVKQKEFVLSKQLLSSGTSVGANVEEALQAESRKDFISKLSISLKEAHETRYWIRLIRDGGHASEQETSPLLSEINELIFILTAIIKSTKKRAEK